MLILMNVSFQLQQQKENAHTHTVYLCSFLEINITLFISYDGLHYFRKEYFSNQDNDVSNFALSLINYKTRVECASFKL